MQIDATRTVAYVGAGAAVGGGFAALRAGGSAKLVAMGVATGVAAGAAQTLVHEGTGSSELGWLGSIGTGAVAGAVLLPGLTPGARSPLAARGIGAAIGAGAGLLAPVVAGMVLAQLRPDDGT
jgi:hypothetical protein